ncbi:Transcriptional regulator [marine gamma proteobacterium HTCC2143]|uniref:Transcriptional regulator n=1 Tax=marine gamma proteobacterium HTCC2143 TaxID=247633 RepID=A0YB44_9GAMM|nr:Transcriptional regulator [marine gamma proteobacterium HTCC2143]
MTIIRFLFNTVTNDKIGFDMARAKIGNERKEQILSAFENCVLRNGLEKTTLQDVANEAGLPRSLVRYFVGNRSDMANLLIDRMIERAESDLKSSLLDNNKPTLNDLLNFVIDGAFSNEKSNSIIDELWYLSEKNNDIRTRLAQLYSLIQTQIIDEMKNEKIGKNLTDRKAFAHTVMSLAYGRASFEHLGMVSAKGATKKLIDAMLNSLQ